MRQVTTILFPRRHFRTQDNEGYVTPALFLLAAVIPDAFLAVYSTWWLLNDVPSAGGLSTYLLTGAVTAAIPVLVWISVTVAFRVVSLAFTLGGAFRQLLWLSSVGMIPYAFSTAITMYVTVGVLHGLQSPDSLEAVERVSAVLQSDPRVRNANLLYFPFLGWSGLIWAAAVRVSLPVTTRQSILVVAGPVAALATIHWVVAI